MRIEDVLKSHGIGKREIPSMDVSLGSIEPVDTGKINPSMQYYLEKTNELVIARGNVLYLYQTNNMKTAIRQIALGFSNLQISEENAVINNRKIYVYDNTTGSLIRLDLNLLNLEQNFIPVNMLFGAYQNPNFCFDEFGNIYVYQSSIVKKFDKDGVFLEEISLPVSGNNPKRVVSNNIMYLFNSDNIVAINLTTKQTISNKPLTSNNRKTISQYKGYIYVAEYTNTNTDTYIYKLELSTLNLVSSVNHSLIGTGSFEMFFHKNNLILLQNSTIVIDIETLKLEQFFSLLRLGVSGQEYSISTCASHLKANSTNEEKCLFFRPELSTSQIVTLNLN